MIVYNNKHIYDMNHVQKYKYVAFSHTPTLCISAHVIGRLLMRARIKSWVRNISRSQHFLMSVNIDMTLIFYCVTLIIYCVTLTFYCVMLIIYCVTLIIYYINGYIYILYYRLYIY